MGKVRYVGYSNFDHHPPLDRQVLELQRKRGWDVMISSQPRWSLVDRHIEKAHLALCRKWGVGLFVYSPLAQGVLTNKYAGGKVPEGSRATSDFKHFLENEKAMTPDNIAAAERLDVWAKKKGLAGAAEAALAWVLSRPQVSSAIIGATKLEQLEANVKAAEVKLSAADWKEAEAVVRGRPARAAKRPARGKAKRKAKRAR
jgi:aryl-alcohol dehydrogenase-like predicted oxidoreductase